MNMIRSARLLLISCLLSFVYFDFYLLIYLLSSLSFLHYCVFYNLLLSWIPPCLCGNRQFIYIKTKKHLTAMKCVSEVFLWLSLTQGLAMWNNLDALMFLLNSSPLTKHESLCRYQVVRCATKASYSLFCHSSLHGQNGSVNHQVQQWQTQVKTQSNSSIRTPKPSYGACRLVLFRLVLHGFQLPLFIQVSPSHSMH